MVNLNAVRRTAFGVLTLPIIIAAELLHIIGLALEWLGNKMQWHVPLFNNYSEGRKYSGPWIWTYYLIVLSNRKVEGLDSLIGWPSHAVDIIGPRKRRRRTNAGEERDG
jgi:hypothetical protein